MTLEAQTSEEAVPTAEAQAVVASNVANLPPVSHLIDNYSGTVEPVMSGTYNTAAYQSPFLMDELLIKFKDGNHHWIESFLTFS